MARSIPTKEEAFGLLRQYVADAIAELEEHQAYIEELARRRLWNKALKAGVDATPEGSRLAGYIFGNERGCDAALRRLEIRQKPTRPGRGPESGESSKSEIRNPNKESPKRPGHPLR